MFLLNVANLRCLWNPHADGVGVRDAEEAGGFVAVAGPPWVD